MNKKTIKKLREIFKRTTGRYPEKALVVRGVVAKVSEWRRLKKAWKRHKNEIFVQK